MESVRLTLGDLEIIWLRHERMPKRKQVPEQTMASWYHQKSAEVVVTRQRAPATGEVSRKDEGLNVRRKELSNKLSGRKKKESRNT